MPQGGKRNWRLVLDEARSRAVNSRAVKHFVVKLVKSLGRLGDATESLDDATESLDDFRYG